jgi:hypothetical protein
MSQELQVRTLIGSADPARGVAVPPARATAAAIIARVEDVPVRRHSRRLVLAAAATTGLAAATLPFVLSRKDEQVVGAGVVVPIAYQVDDDPPPAGSYLRDLARQIGDAPYDVHSGRYTYHRAKWWGGMHIRSVEGHIMSYVEERETWAGADGSGRRRTRTLPPEYPDEESRRYWEQQRGKPATLPQDQELPAGQAGPTEPLPTDRARLAELVEIRHGPGAVAKKLGTMYEEYGIPLASRALILEVLAGVPDFVWRGQVTDRAGRAGVAVTAEDHGQQVVLVFDSRTGVLLAHENVLPKPRRVGAYQLLLAMDRTDTIG